MRNIILYALAMMSISVHAQLRMEVEELTVHNIKPEYEEGIAFDEYAENGPYVEATCRIYNKSEVSQTIFPSEASFYFTFTYRHDKHRVESVPIAFLEHEKLTIASGQDTVFYLQEHLFLGTPLLNGDKLDYTQRLLETLPTLRVRYQEGSKVINSTKISSVIIKD